MPRIEHALPQSPSSAPVPRLSLSRVLAFLLLLAAIALSVASARADKVDDLITNEMTAHQIPGLALAVIRDGRVEKLAAYGVANLELQAAATTNTVFEIGSITKQFTAACILLLAREGKLSIDDRISQHLETPAAWTNITIRHLLTHTSGIKSYTELGGFELSRHLTRQQFINALGGIPLEFAPGERWKYCNSGYNLLGFIIEKVAGQSYWSFLAERILRPLGMSATTNRDPALVIANRANGYKRRNGVLMNRDYDLTDVFSAGAMVSTIGDLVKWNAALDAGTILDAAAKREMWMSGKLNNGKDCSYGFGWRIGAVDGHTNIGHSGSTAGFSASLQRFPGDNLAVIVLCNLDEPNIATTLARSVARLTFSPGQVPTTNKVSTVFPRENTNAVLRNPDMGWVLYENYPLDQDPHGSSTLLTVPNETFPEVSAVALMFSWQDIEQVQDTYDFSKADFAYDYWRNRGKEIQLRLSTASLMWWARRQPPAGLGAPDYVLAQMAPEEKQMRKMDSESYRVEDTRNPFYQERLCKFLTAVRQHFRGNREVTVIDLRGFGAWGEWHSGFRYPALNERHTALTELIDLWCDALPEHRLSLSFSYDPDGPKALYAGPSRSFDERFTTNYSEFLYYSAFDHALTKSNVTFRRDGCGGAVHSNERKLCEQAFSLGRGPVIGEFLGGYGQAKKGGTNWVNWMIDDALSLHPNYINLLGWQGADALAFTRERPDLVRHGALKMGYRLVPVKVQFPAEIAPGKQFSVTIDWVNRGVGRALVDYELGLALAREGVTKGESWTQTISTSKWVGGITNTASTTALFNEASDGDYHLCLAIRDPRTRRNVDLPLDDQLAPGWYDVGKINVRAGTRL